MCGIAGAISFTGLQPDRDYTFTKKMIDTLIHRGPDASGFFADDKVALGHRRLSIIDLISSADQPMLSHDSNIVVSFNGEIYNYQQIRHELENSYHFKTRSDTEVIIAAYIKWGESFLEHLNGMFAIAVYDKRKRVVYLCRDRLGQKPLYWINKNGVVYFSSENQAFFKAGVLKSEFNESAIYNYLTFLTTTSPDSFFKGVHKVEAGYFCKISASGVEHRKYWDVANFINQENKITFDDAVVETQSLLEQAMKYRNISDVPVSIALSGGLDSSMNLCFSKKYRNDKIGTINISYAQKCQYDESVIAQRYANDCGSQYFSKRIDQSEFNSWINEYLSISRDVPTGDPNTALVYGISKLAKDSGYKVLLVGEGGDEVGGYPVYDRLQKIGRYDSKFSRGFVGLLNNPLLPSRLKNELDVFSGAGPVIRRFIFGFTENQKRNFWKKAFSTNSYNDLINVSKQINVNSPDEFLRKILNIEYKVRLAELLLPRVDLPSMAASVEARSPFMDYKLIEFSAGLPFSLKMQDGAKSILKQIAKQQLPDYIVKQPKVGFGQLLTPFLQSDIPVWFHREILSVDCPIKEYVDTNFLERLYKQHLSKRKLGYKLWIMYSLNRWMLNCYS